MESDARSTVFLLSCNDLSKITEAVQSRSLAFSFHPIDEASLRSILRQAAGRLPCPVPANVNETIVRSSPASPRAAIHRLIEAAALPPVPVPLLAP